MSISFIIPYHNIECHFLTRCIDSIRALGNELDLEIIVIDDGTPQSKAKECIESYQDSRIKYTLIPYSGPGGARNKGLELASKEYVQMIDSDDYIFLAQEQEILKIVEKKSPEALIFNYKKVYEKYKTDSHQIIGNILYEGDIIEYMSTHDIPPSCCMYILKRSIIGSLRFTPNILHEDEEFSTLLYLNIKNAIVTDYYAYAYYQRQGSIINSTNEKFIDKRFSDLRLVIDKIKTTTAELNKEDRRHNIFLRKTNILAMCFVINLIRTAYSYQFISKELAHLKTMELYPLASGNYGFRYSIIRILTICPLFVKVGYFIISKIRK